MAEETPPAQKTYDQVKADLKGYLLDMGLEIIKDFDTAESCGYWTKFGDFPILIESRKPLKYCIVALQFTFSEGAIVQAINEHYEKQDHEFIFRLTQVLTSPQTSFVRVVESGRVIGFTIMKSIYPFHPGFTIHKLDEAIQAVTAVGAVGIAFLKSEMGQMALDHTPPAPGPGPGPMYG
ncbi:MAG: hypothetical protein A4E35_01959 [Methanoregula sp. PtaU1.Bin051]|nr:MAG: hypothetical protein A4E35_01959 [Methanoregula sp. PtaU1.Bin051]